MKSIPRIVLGVSAAFHLLSPVANAQVPSSIAGSGLLIGITYGTYPLASYGYSLFLPANSGNSYQGIGIYAVADANGTYSYAVTGPSTAELNLYSAASGYGVATVGFTTPISGTFDYASTTYPGLNQGGNFLGAIGTAASSLSGKSISCTVAGGLYPFASSGNFILTTAPAGNTYTVTGSGGVANSSGTFSYSVVNRSTGAMPITDSVTGAGTVYLGFADPSSGFYAVKSPSGSFQIGTFIVLDTTPPTVSISSPASAKTYTNAQTVTITANASDNVGVTSVAFYDGTALKSTDATAPYSCDWSFTAADNGAHVWTARASDAAGNVSTSSPVMLTVSIDITSPTVAISSPTNGAVLATSPATVSGTASDPGSPASGVAGVEVRLNGGSWSNATGTTTWTCSVTLSPCSNTIEARSRDYAGNYSFIASNFITYTPPNTPPNTPSNVYPPNGATDVSVTPTLEASAFSDPDCVGDTHAASQWQVLDSAGAVVVAESGTDTVNKLSWTVPSNKLHYGSNYQWHVRYRDSRDGWSSYSAQTRFTNRGPLLSASMQLTNMVVKWPTNTLGFALQWSTNLETAIWSDAASVPVIVGGQYTVTNNMTNTVRFYRLKK